MSSNGPAKVANPTDPNMVLEPTSASHAVEKVVHPQKEEAAEDSAVTKAEKFERHAVSDDFSESPAKRVKLDRGNGTPQEVSGPTKSERRKGVAPVKAESVFSGRPRVGLKLTISQVSGTRAW